LILKASSVSLLCTVVRGNHLAKLSIQSFHFTFTTYVRTGDPTVLIFIKVYDMLHARSTWL